VRKSGGLDFEAEGRHEEVQKERERVAEWTLKWREMRGSPKGASKSCGLDFEEEGDVRKSKRSEKSGRLDFEVEGRQEKVQKERERAADWTLR